MSFLKIYIVIESYILSQHIIHKKLTKWLPNLKTSPLSPFSHHVPNTLASNTAAPNGPNSHLGVGDVPRPGRREVKGESMAVKLS